MSASTSPLPYTGNKSCIVNTILSVMPKHDVYIEPCMGSAEVFFRIGEDDQLFVFEAPIDMLSYITLNPDGWEQHSYVACCGTSSIPVLNMIDGLPQLRQVFLCLDNDKAGHTSSERMVELIADRGLRADRLTPEHKDWNEDLVSEYAQEEVQTYCQISGF